MKSPHRTLACSAFGAVVLLVAALSVAVFIGCGGGGAGGRGVGSICGYAYVGHLTAGRMVSISSTVISTCSSTPPSNFGAAAGYLVYLDDTVEPADATCGDDGYWVVEVSSGQHTVYICPPTGPPALLTFQVTVLAGQLRCQPSHEQGGG